MDQHPNKVTIVSYTDKKLQKEDLKFVIPINPEQYAQTFKLKYDSKPASP